MQNNTQSRPHLLAQGPARPTWLPLKKHQTWPAKDDRDTVSALVKRRGTPARQYSPALPLGVAWRHLAAHMQTQPCFAWHLNPDVTLQAQLLHRQLEVHRGSSGAPPAARYSLSMAACCCSCRSAAAGRHNTQTEPRHCESAGKPAYSRTHQRPGRHSLPSGDGQAAAGDGVRRRAAAPHSAPRLLPPPWPPP